MEFPNNTRVYKQLPSERHIRLIQLHAGENDEPISISLAPAVLDDVPSYEALSYVWGNANDRQIISCDGRDFAVTRNLYEALHRFRLPDGDRMLWADAICINQEDPDERAQQVRIMHLIYKSCTRCLVWLGPSDKHSETALEVVRDITNIVCRRLSMSADELDARLRISGRDPRQALDMGFTDLPGPESTKWGSLFHFLCRPWFSRIWVIQEVYFAKSAVFFCGQHTVSYASLYHTADWVLNNGTDVTYRANSTMSDYMTTARFNIMNMRGSQWEEGNQELKVLLDQVKDFNATDLRDKIYALIHLPPFRREYPDIEINYRIWDYDVYADVARRIIAYEKGLGILTTVDRNPKIPSEGPLPSWVPRWHRVNIVPNVSSMWYQFFSAGTGDTAPVLLLDDLKGKVLSVPGFELDVIEDVCRIELRGARSQIPPLQPVFHVDEPWKPYTRSPESPYPVEPDIIQAYAMTFTAMMRGVGGWWARRCPEDEFDHHRADFVAWLQWLRAAGEADGPGSHYPPGLYSRERPFLNDTTEEGLLEFATRYQMMLQKYHLQRRLFRTRKGYLGLGGHGLLKGDRICILAGGAVPFILRPRSTGEHHEFIGDAYVHGVMDGEALANRDASVWVKFHLD